MLPADTLPRGVNNPRLTVFFLFFFLNFLDLRVFSSPFVLFQLRGGHRCSSKHVCR